MLPIDWLYRSARGNPDARAIDAPDVTLSYGELASSVDALAAALQKLDSSSGSRVGVCGHNTVEHLLSILAVMAAGKVWVPLNPLDASVELETKIALARPGLMIVDGDCASVVENVEVPVVIGRTHPGGEKSAVSVNDLIERHRGDRPLRENHARDATQAIKFTGGSSGAPKGVLQPYRAWMAGAVNMLGAHGFGDRDRFLLAAPLTHGTSCYITPMLAVGGTLVLLNGRAKPDTVIEALTEKQVTATFLPPTLIYMLLDWLAGGDTRFEQLRLLIYGAAPMPADRVLEAQQCFGAVIGGNYGLTEAPQIITALKPEDARGDRLASAGRAGLLNRVEILDGAGRILPPGEAGEVVVSGDLVMTGYLDLAEQTAETLDGGWLHTGDLGHLDEQGFLYITDRIKDVIITGGFNVYPGEVERALAAHPAVSECVVFGMTDRKWGEAVHAAVTLRNAADASGEEIIAFVKTRLGSVKAPKRIHVLDDVPRSAVGKVQRRKVKALVEEMLRSSAGLHGAE